MNLAREALRQNIVLTEELADRPSAHLPHNLDATLAKLAAVIRTDTVVAYWADVHGPLCVARYMTEEEHE